MQDSLDPNRGQISFSDLRRQVGPIPAGEDHGVDVEPLVEALNPQAPSTDISGGPRLRRGPSEPDAEAPEGGTNPPSERMGDSGTPEVQADAQQGGTTTDSHQGGASEEDAFRDSHVPGDGGGQFEVYVLRNKSMKTGQIRTWTWARGHSASPNRRPSARQMKKQWLAHVAIGFVRVARLDDAKGVGPARILPFHARCARTNKSKDGGPLNAKGRLVVPGHLAPKGGVRTDAPVAPQVCLYWLLRLAATKSWPVGAFDVADALLPRKAHSRKLYGRPLREGLKRVPQEAFIELFKSAFELKESPPLLWLQLRDAVLEAGFEAQGAPGVFRLRDQKGRCVECCASMCTTACGPVLAPSSRRPSRISAV